MDHRPTPLLPWLCGRFAESPEKAPDYSAAARDFTNKTGHAIEPDSLRHIARGYKRPSGILAVAIQSWTEGTVTAVAMLTWPHYGRQAA